MEYRRKCNVCGKIYCYSDKDLKDNNKNSAMAAISAVGAIASVFGGTRLDTYALNSQGNKYNDKVIDYNKCPSCNSSDTSLISETELPEIQQKESTSVKSQIIQAKKIEINSNATAESLLKRTKMFLEEEDWDSASAYCEHILDLEPECAMAYVYKLMIVLKVSEQEKLALLSNTFSDEKLYQKALNFADDSLKSILEGYNYSIIERNNEKQYSSSLIRLNEAKTEKDYQDLIPSFKALGKYKDSAQKVRECEEKAVLCKYNHAIQLKEKAKTEKDFLEAKAEFDSMGSYSDSVSLSAICKDKAEEARKNTIYEKAVSMANSIMISTVENAVTEFEKISGWRDADQQKVETLKRVNQLKKAEKKAANKKKTICIFSFSAVIVCIAIVLLCIQVIKINKYKSAQKKYESEDYIAAIQLWLELEDYKDSKDKVQDSIKQVYNEAMDLVEQEEYDAAITKLDSIAGYLSTVQDKAHCNYLIALVYAQNGDYSNALNKLASVPSSDEVEKLQLFCKSAQELKILDDGEIHDIPEICQNIDNMASQIDVSLLYDNEVINMMMSFDGTWEITSEYNIHYIVIKRGFVRYLDENKEDISWWTREMYYQSGYIFMDKTANGEYLFEISDYSGANDNTFTLDGDKIYVRQQ